MATKSKPKSRVAIQITPEPSTAGEVKVFWTSSSSNSKTGDLPTMFIGDSKEQTARTCCEAGCPLLPTDKGGPFVREKGKNACYAWSGTVQMAAIRLLRKAKTLPSAYKIENALANSSLNARFVRISAIGDPISLTQAQVDEVKNGLAKHNEEYRSKDTALRIIGYTHGWNQDGAFEKWGDSLMASCHSLEDADKAFDQGWRPALESTFDSDPGRIVTTPKGRKLMVCPHLLSEELKPKMLKDCNACGWCAVQDSKFKMGIVFPNHR